MYFYISLFLCGIIKIEIAQSQKSHYKFESYFIKNERSDKINAHILLFQIKSNTFVAKLLEKIISKVYNYENV